MMIVNDLKGKLPHICGCCSHFELIGHLALGWETVGRCAVSEEKNSLLFLSTYPCQTGKFKERAILKSRPEIEIEVVKEAV